MAVVILRTRSHSELRGIHAGELTRFECSTIETCVQNLVPRVGSADPRAGWHLAWEDLRPSLDLWQN